MGYKDISRGECVVCAKRDVHWECEICCAVICASVYCKQTHDLDHAPDEPDEDQRAVMREP